MRHGLYGAHELLVLTLGVVDQCHGGLGQLGQVGDLTRVVHAQLDHGHAVVGAQIEQGQGHANVVVQVALGGQGVVSRMGTQDGRDHLCHGGLAVAAGHGDQRQTELRTPPSRQLTQSDACIGHHQRGQAVRRSLRLARGLTHHGYSALRLGLGHELVAIKTLTTQSHKQVTCLQAAAVGVHPIGHHTLHVHTASLAQPAQGETQTQLHGHRGFHTVTPWCCAVRCCKALRTCTTSENGWRTPMISCSLSWPLPATSTTSCAAAWASASSIAKARSS